MFAVDGVFEGILERCGFQPSAGHPLYSYRLTESELEQLASVLTDRFKEGTSLRPKESAAFCLFAATFFCRHHKTGVWSWEEVLSAVDFDQVYSKLYPIVRSGLSFLGRRMILDDSGQSRYLTTLACEGGLPLHVIETPGNSVPRFFRSILKHREIYPVDVIDTLSICQRNKEYLPATLQNQNVFELAATLIEAIVDVRSHMPQDMEDPYAWLLDRPSELDKIPMYLDAEVARRFLKGLIETPRHLPRSKVWVGFVRKLIWEHTGVQLVREIELPARLKVEELYHRFELQEDPPVRAFLYAKKENGELLHLGVLTQLCTGYQVDANKNTIVPPLGELRLLLSCHLGGELGEGIANAGEDLGPLPWYFSSPDGLDESSYLGEGSIRTREPAVIAAIPPGAVVDCDQPLAKEMGSLNGRTLLYLDHSCDIRLVDGSSCGVELCSEGSEGSSFRLHGETLQFGYGGDEVFRGMPKIAVVAADRTVKQVLDGSCNRGHAGDQFGKIDVEHSENGSLLFRKSAVVLPRDFRFSISPSNRGGRGELAFSSAELDMVLPRRVPGVVVRRLDNHETEGHGDFAFEYEADANAMPGAVTVDFEFRNAGSCTILASFPAACVSFVKQNGEAADNRTKKSIVGILGMRVRVVSQDPDARHYLEAVGNGGRTHLAEIGALRDTPNCRELSLDLVRSQVVDKLHGGGLDPEVRLEVSTDGPQRETPVLRVGLFESEFEFEENKSRIVADAQNGRVIIEARPLWDPRRVERLHSDGDGRFVFDHEGRDPGPWLVSGRIGDVLVIRPTAITVRGETTDSMSALHKASHVAYQDLNRSLDTLLKEMARDLEHETWAILPHFLDDLSLFPASTFRQFERLVGLPDTLIMFILKARSQWSKAHLWRAFEQLLFVWELVPLTAWLKVTKRIFTQFENLEEQLAFPGLAESSKKQLREAFDVWSEYCPSLRVCTLILDWLRSPGRSKKLSGEIACTSVGRSRMMALFTEPGQPLDQMQGLLRRNSRAQWIQDVRIMKLVSSSRIQIPEYKFSSDQSNDARRSVLFAPLAAALVAGGFVTASPQDVMVLKRIKEFDSVWFREMTRVALSMVVGSAIEKDENYFHDA